MTIPVWPTAFLPAEPLWARYDASQELPIIRTSMDGGRARQRQRYGHPMQTVSLQWVMSNTELQFFIGWVASLAGYGASFFQITLALDGAARTHDARFIGTVRRERQSADGWLVSATLEVKAVPELNADGIDVIVNIGVAELQGAAAATVGLTLQPAFDTWLAEVEDA